MSRAGLVLAAAVVLGACGPKPPGPAEPAKPKLPALEPLPADALLWEGELPPGVDKSALLEKDGVLVRTPEPPPDADTVRTFPFSLDYWLIGRTDLETLLAPHVGRRVRVTGHFKKTWDDGTWSYEVAPVRIVALADAPKPPRP